MTGTARWVAVGVAVAIAAGVAYFARSSGDAKKSTCTLSVPAQLAVDAPALEFTATKQCTDGGATDVTWTATVGSTKTSELRFQRQDSAVTEVYSADPFGVWTWKMTKTDDPDTAYNEPVTEVRSKSTVTTTAEQQPGSGTKVTFQVSRYDITTGKMEPWRKAAGTLESRTAPAAEDAPFAPAAEITSDDGGNVVLMLRPEADQQYRVTISAAADTFGSTSDHVFVGKTG